MRAGTNRLPRRSGSRRTTKDRRPEARKSSRTRLLGERVAGIGMRDELRAAPPRHDRQAGTWGLRHGRKAVGRAAQTISGRDEATPHRGCRAAAGRPAGGGTGGGPGPPGVPEDGAGHRGRPPRDRSRRRCRCIRCPTAPRRADGVGLPSMQGRSGRSRGSGTSLRRRARSDAHAAAIVLDI